MKNMILPVAVFVAIVGCVLAVSANVSSSGMYDNLKNERYLRIVAEEKLQKAEKIIQALNTELKDSRDKIESIGAILNQGRTVADDLRSQLDKTSVEKAQLLKQFEQFKMEQGRQSKAQQQAAEVAPPR